VFAVAFVLLLGAGTLLGRLPDRAAPVAEVHAWSAGPSCSRS
jgi:hypothetical protein